MSTLIELPTIAALTTKPGNRDDSTGDSNSTERVGEGAEQRAHGDGM